MKNELIRTITRNAIVAAIYVVLTVSTTPISYGMVQIRVSEFLMLLCFFRKDYIVGLTIGCFIANIFSPFPIDMLVGTAATFVACLLICFASFKNLFLAALYPVLANGIIVGGIELSLIYDTESFWLCTGWVALGEIIAVLFVGYPLFMILWREQRLLTVFGANRNLEPKW